MACRDCYFWRPQHEHSNKAPCMWPGVSFIPPSVVEIKKIPMRGEDGGRCTVFKDMKGLISRGI